MNKTQMDQIGAFSQHGHKRAVLYARVSSDDRGKDGRNLQSQLEMCHGYAQERGYTVVAELAEDDRGASGASFELPELSQLLAMAERGEYDVLVVREIDRLSRNLAKQLIVEESLRRAGICIEYVLGEYPNTPEGNLNKHIRASIAEFEREKIRERNERGRRNIVKSGRIMLHGDRPPYGYRTVTKERNGKQIVVGLVIYEPEARIIRLIYQWYAEGDENGRRLSFCAIAKRLTEMKIPTWSDIHGWKIKKQGIGEWQDSTVSHIIACETYKGIWYYGRQHGVKGNKINPREHWIPLQVPAIIDPTQWQLAQKRRSQNIKTSPRNVKHDYLMRCRVRGACNYALCATARTFKGKTYLYYASRGHCRVTQKCSDCGLCFRADHVDQLVWDWLKSWLKDPTDLARKLEAYKAERERANGPILALLRANENLITENQVQLDRVKDMYQMGVIKQDELVERKMRLGETIAKLETERVDLEARLSHELDQDQIEEIVAFARRLSAGLDNADRSFAARQHIVDLLDVRVIAAIEEGKKVIYVSFVLTLQGEQGQRMVLPPRTRGPLLADCEDQFSKWSGIKYLANPHRARAGTPRWRSMAHSSVEKS